MVPADRFVCLVQEPCSCEPASGRLYFRNIRHYNGFSSFVCIHKQFEQADSLYTGYRSTLTFRLRVLFFKSFVTSQRLWLMQEQTPLKSNDDMVPAYVTAEHRYVKTDSQRKFSQCRMNISGIGKRGILPPSGGPEC